MPKTKIKTADAAIKRIVSDNAAFMRSHPLVGFFDKFLGQQTPFVTIVLCSDSRCQLEAFCSQPFNNAFEVANAGNRFRADKFSVSFAVKYLETPVLMVIGHTDCGAIKAAMGDYSGEDEDICAGLDGLHLALKRDDESMPFETRVLINVIVNVNLQVEAAMRTYTDLVATGKLTIIGGVFDMHNQLGKGNGKLHLFNINNAKTIAELSAHPACTELTEKQKAATLLDLSTLIPSGTKG